MSLIDTLGDDNIRAAFGASLLMIVFCAFGLLFKWLLIVILLLFLVVAIYTGYYLFVKKKDGARFKDSIIGGLKK